MSNTNFDLAEFQARVTASIGEFGKIMPTNYAITTRGASRGASESKSIRHRSPQEIEAELEELERRKEEAEKLLEKPRELVNRRDIRTRLCPALRSVTNDAYDIGKVVTPLLFGAILGHQIFMPLDDVLFAGISLVIARMGISSICAGYGDENKKA